MAGRATPSRSSRAPAVPAGLVLSAALAGAVLVGGAVALRPELGLGAALGLAYVPLVLLNLPLGIAAWVATVPLATVTPAPTLAGAVVLFAWLGVVGTRRTRAPALDPEHRRALLATSALVLWVLTTMAWAPRSMFGSEVFLDWLLVAAVMHVVSTTVVGRRHLRWVATAFVLGMVLSVATGLVGAVRPVDGRLVGGSGDPNVLAAGIVPAVVLAFSLCGSRVGVVRRSAMLLAVPVLVLGLVGTQSRGGLVAAVVAAAAALVVARRARSSIVGALLVTGGASGLWVSVNPAAWERMTDLGESSGRSELWQVGWRMWQDHPVTGVGLGGFRDHSRDYVFEFGPLRYAEYLVEVPKLVHNVYLELLTETGLVGLALFLTVVVSSVRCSWRAAGRFDRQGDLQMAALARGTIVALVAILTASANISNATDRRTWILLALGPALLAASRPARTPPPWSRPAVPPLGEPAAVLAPPPSRGRGDTGPGPGPARPGCAPVAGGPGISSAGAGSTRARRRQGDTW